MISLEAPNKYGLVAKQYVSIVKTKLSSVLEIKIITTCFSANYCNLKENTNFEIFYTNGIPHK